MPGLTSSASLHSLEDVARVDAACFDYVFLSPIFDSISKAAHPAASFDSAALAATLAACSVPVLALGGVAPATAARARALGFRGAALLGCVWEGEPCEEGAARAVATVLRDLSA